MCVDACDDDYDCHDDHESLVRRMLAMCNGLMESVVGFRYSSLLV